MNNAYLGELAALGTAALWSVSSLLFTAGGRRVASMMVNRTRLAFAVLILSIMHWLLQGRLFPTGVEPYRYGWLALSSVIGLVIGDGLLFQCYLLVGPRIGVLLLSLAPVFSTILAATLLGERMASIELLGMVIALGGVTWVVLERGRGQATQGRAGRDYRLGLLLGVGAALCQAGNLVTAKQALTGGFPALSATLIRMSVAAVVMWGMAAAQGEFGRTIRTVRGDGRAGLAIFGGSVCGPFLGVWLSMIAVQTSRVGIASTLMAMTPVLSLPLVRLVLKERVTPRAVLGTLVAMAGVAVMILV